MHFAVHDPECRPDFSVDHVNRWDLLEFAKNIITMVVFLSLN